MIKLILLYLALVFIVMIVSGAFIYLSIRGQEAVNVEKDLMSYAQYMDDQYFKNNDSPQAAHDKMFLPSPDYVAPLQNKSDIELCVLDPQGMVLAPVEVAGAYFNDSVIISAAQGKPSYEPWVKRGGKVSQNPVRVWMQYAAPVVSGGKVQYVIYMAKDAGDLINSFNSIINTLVAAVLIAMALAVILGVLFSTTLTGPISYLTKIAGEMARGNLSQEIPVKSKDEIGQLTESFNNMAKSLATTMTDMSIEKSRIEIILNNMTDGVLAYDSSNNLVYANYASLEMLGVSDIDHTPFAQVAGFLGLSIENVMDLTSSVKENILAIKDKFIAISYSPYTGHKGNAQGMVIVLQDVTKHTKLDNMRKEFVANVSHEIRTPLTTIKTYAETLLEGAMEDKNTLASFLDTINGEADRMTLLASDLLELSRFDNKQMKMEFEEANLISLINNSIRQNTVLAQKKGQTIAFTPPAANIFIMCDPARINQVFNNIISNSIKYSPQDSEIWVTLEDMPDCCQVFIADKGIGIPEEDLNRIFERFYRVDKARSRQMGGTGLGLSIAREIMEAHGGAINVVSRPGEGTTMILTFNKL